MKELIHLTHEQCEISDSMDREISRFIENNPDAKYSRVSKEQDPSLFSYYANMYALYDYPVFLGFVNGHLQDGHIGYGTEMIISSLIN